MSKFRPLVVATLRQTQRRALNDQGPVATATEHVAEQVAERVQEIVEPEVAQAAAEAIEEQVVESISEKVAITTRLAITGYHDEDKV